MASAAMQIADRRFDELKAAGGRIETFRTPQFGKLTRYHRRNHRRSIVIDGEVGFTGGMAVGDAWLGNAATPEQWRDMMFKLTGPLAGSLQSAFAGPWASSSGEILVDPEIYMPDPGPPVAGVRRFIHHVHSPAADDLSMAYFFKMPIMAAQESVYIATPYFIPDSHLKRALRERAQAGVDVRILLPGRNTDNHLVRLSAQNHYEELLQAGIRIYEYRPTFLHSKFAVVDGQWSVIGSANLNTRSHQLDEENVFGILDSQLGDDLVRAFLADIEQADEVQLHEWRRRNPLLQLMQRFAQVLNQQS